MPNAERTLEMRSVTSTAPVLASLSSSLIGHLILHALAQRDEDLAALLQSELEARRREGRSPGSEGFVGVEIEPSARASQQAEAWRAAYRQPGAQVLLWRGFGLRLVLQRGELIIFPASGEDAMRVGLEPERCHALLPEDGGELVWSCGYLEVGRDVAEALAAWGLKSMEQCRVEALCEQLRAEANAGIAGKGPRLQPVGPQ
jgi:hypothetical protein